MQILVSVFICVHPWLKKRSQAPSKRQPDSIIIGVPLAPYSSRRKRKEPPMDADENTVLAGNATQWCVGCRVHAHCIALPSFIHVHLRPSAVKKHPPFYSPDSSDRNSRRMILLDAVRGSFSIGRMAAIRIKGFNCDRIAELIDLST